MKRLLLALLLVGLVGCGTDYYPPADTKANTFQLVNKSGDVIVEIDNVVRYSKDSDSDTSYDIYYRKKGKERIYCMFLYGISLAGLKERWAEDD